MTLEIATRWGETLLDVTLVEDGDWRLADVELVRDGHLVATPTGYVGQVQYIVREVPLPPRSVPYTRNADRRVVPYLAAALLVHVGIWGLATATSPPPPERRAKATTTQRPVKVTHSFAVPPKTVAPPDDRARDRVKDTKSQGAGQAATGAEGLAGVRSPNQRGHVAVKNNGEPAQLTKAEAIAQARRAGVLGSAQTIIEQYATLGGSDRLTSAFDQIDVAAPVSGGEGTASGNFGAGVVGAGGGGGGTGYGTIGTGRYGTFSRGTTHGHGWGGSVAPVTREHDWMSWQHSYPYSYSPMPMRRLGYQDPFMRICPASGAPVCTVEGALDKAVVRRYVKRNSPKLTYCYEKELLSHPELSGDVLISFQIRGDGRVENASAVGVSSEVAACVREVIASLELPRGPAQVEYVVRYTKPSYKRYLDKK